MFKEKIDEGYGLIEKLSKESQDRSLSAHHEGSVQAAQLEDWFKGATKLIEETFGDSSVELQRWQHLYSSFAEDNTIPSEEGLEFQQNLINHIKSLISLLQKLDIENEKTPDLSTISESDNGQILSRTVSLNLVLFSVVVLFGLLLILRLGSEDIAANLGVALGILVTILAIFAAPFVPELRTIFIHYTSNTEITFILVILVIFVVVIFLLSLMPSPTVTGTTIRPNVDCESANVIDGANTDKIVGQAHCEIQLALGEAIVGAAQELNSIATCVEFFIQGPVSIANLQLANANWTIYRNPEFNDQQVSAYLENERNRLTREVRDCSNITLDTILIPSVILIPSNNEQGVTFSAPFDGLYSIQIVGGAYSTHSINDPTEYTDRWRSAIAVYVNRGIDWQPRPYSDTDNLNMTYLEPRNTDYILGSLGNRNQSAAMNVGISSQSEEVDMRVGDYLVFVAIDDQGWYANNQGDIEIQISLKPK